MFFEVQEVHNRQQVSNKNGTLCERVLKLQKRNSNCRFGRNDIIKSINNNNYKSRDNIRNILYDYSENVPEKEDIVEAKIWKPLIRCEKVQKTHDGRVIYMVKFIKII